MKKILEVIIDDDGKMKFNSECPFGITKADLERDPELKSKKTLAKMDEALKLAIEGFVDCTWKDKNESIYPIIRTLSMAEIMSTAQPYSQTENFWFSMMHSLIPRMESFAGNLKYKYGFNDKDVVRPMTWINPEFADMFGLDLSMSSVDDQMNPFKFVPMKTPSKWS